MSDRQYEVEFTGFIFVDAAEVDEQGAEQAVQNAIGFTGVQVSEAERLGEVRGA